MAGVERAGQSDLEAAKAAIEEAKRARLKAFIADVETACQVYGGTIEPQMIITGGGVEARLLFKVSE